MVIGIVGSRRRGANEDISAVRNALSSVVQEFSKESGLKSGVWSYISFVSGGCAKGADSFAEIIAEELGVPIKVHYPQLTELDKDLLATNPRIAYAKINYARNTKIAEDSDVLIACVASDRKGGTEDTVKKYKKLGKTKLILC